MGNTLPRASRKWRLSASTALLFLVLGATGPAWAQAGGGGAGGGGGSGIVSPESVGAQPENEVLQQPAPSAAGQNKLLGDLGGLRSRLVNQGINLLLDYTAEPAGNVSGQRTGTTYTSQIGFEADLDWEKIAGVPGLNTHFVIINRNGNNLSSRYIGDRVSQAQEIYGAGFNMGVKFVYLYAEEKLFGDRLNIAAGRLPVNVDFAASPLYCIPVSLSSSCGAPRAVANYPGSTNWPQSSWGGRVRGRPTPDTYIQFGAYEVDPFPAGGRTGWDWSTSRSTGASFPVEVGWEPVFGANQLPGHYRVGYIHDTSDYPDLETNDLGQPIGFFNNLPGSTHSGRNTYYALADQMLWRQGPGLNQGIILVTQYAYSTESISTVAQTAFGGIVDKGFWPARPNDQIMLSLGWFGMSNRLGSLQSLDIATGRPIANGASGRQRNEYIVELDYTLPVYRGVTIEPAIQYFVNPNAQTNIKNAFVFAGRLHVDF
jgi:porin